MSVEPTVWSMSRFLNLFKLDNFIISLESSWKNVFDTSILLVIAYSCLTTVYFVSFNQPIGPELRVINWGVTIIFACDFFFICAKSIKTKKLFRELESIKTSPGGISKVAGWSLIFWRLFHSMLSLEISFILNLFVF